MRTLAMMSGMPDGGTAVTIVVAKDRGCNERTTQVLSLHGYVLWSGYNNISSPLSAEIKLTTNKKHRVTALTVLAFDAMS